MSPIRLHVAIRRAVRFAQGVFSLTPFKPDLAQAYFERLVKCLERLRRTPEIRVVQAFGPSHTEALNWARAVAAEWHQSRGNPQERWELVRMLFPMPLRLQERLVEEAAPILPAKDTPKPALPNPAPSTGTQQAEGGKPTVARGLRGVPLAEANILVRDWLMKHAKDDPASTTRDAVAKGTGVSPAQVSRTDAWKAFRERRDAEKKPKSRREISLTDGMLSNIPSKVKRPEELSTLIEEQQQELAEEERRYKRRSENRSE